MIKVFLFSLGRSIQVFFQPFGHKRESVEEDKEQCGEHGKNTKETTIRGRREREREREREKRKEMAG